MEKKLHTLKTVMLFFIITVSFTTLNAQTKLTSTNLIGSTTAWESNAPVDLNTAFDGDHDTFVDGWENWGYLGYDFGDTGVAVTTFNYAPRSGFASRLENTELRGSNSSDFLNDFDVLHTITATPSEGVLTSTQVSSSSSYRYIYWFGPAGTYANISEFQLLDAGTNVLTGTQIGFQGGSQWCADCTYDKAFDNNFDTYVEGPTTIGYVGYDFGASSGAKVTSFKYGPRQGWEGRLDNTELRGSNDPDYLNNYTVLATIAPSPTYGALTDIVSNDNTTAFRYVYWKGTDNSYGNIAELEVYGSLESLSVSKMKLSNAFKVFPNPSNGNSFNISSNQFKGSVNIKIYNVLGKIILNKDFTSVTKTINIKHELNSGLYIVKVNNKASTKLIVK